MIKFLKTSKLEDLREFVQNYADENGYVDIRKLSSAIKELGLDINNFASYIAIASDEPEIVKFAEILRANNYKYSDIVELTSELCQCVDNAHVEIVLSDNDSEYINRLASLHIESKELLQLFYR